MAEVLPTPAQPWMAGANGAPMPPTNMTTEPAQPEMADTATAGLSGAAPGAITKAPAQPPEPHVSVARHILEALGGAAGPMGWAKSVIAGGLAGAANVGTIPEGGGALTGIARGAAGFQQYQRQQALDAQAKQKEQFEQQMKQKADARAEQALQNQTLETNAQVATANARTLATIHEDQRAQALAPYMEEEKRVNLDNIHDARAKSAAEIKAIAIRAGVDPKDLEESHTSYDNATPQQVHSVGSGDTLLLHNGEVAKQGEDGVGVHAVSGGISLFDKPLKTDTKVISGYEFDAKGNPVPKTTTMSAGHTVADAYALYLAAQEDLSSHQAQLTAAADLSKKQSEAQTAGVTAQNAQANETLSQRGKVADIRLKGAEAEKSALEQQLLQKQIDDPDSMTPKEVHALQKSGQAESSKTQKDFNTFLQSANSIEGSIKLAKGGNELASAIIPLQGTLFITTAEGVKRINETELSGVAGSGNIIRRGQNAYEKFVNGDTSEGTKADLAALIEVYKKAKYQQYLNNEDVTAKNYRLGDSQTVFDITGNPTTLGEARKKVTQEAAPTAKGEAGKIHANMTDFAQHYAGAKGEIFSDDGKTWYYADGSIVK